MDLTMIVLEMQDRIIKLEKEVIKLNKEIDKLQDNQEVKQYEVNSDYINLEKGENNKSESIIKTRDKTRYMYKDNVYLKNKLVYVIVKDYVHNNPSITKQDLLTVFPREIQGSIGVVVNIETAKLRSDYTLRFFTQEDEILHLVDGDMVVCSQWGIMNIPRFIDKAKILNYKIEKV